MGVNHGADENFATQSIITRCATNGSEALPHRSQAELQLLFEPILSAVERQSGVAGRFVDKDLYQIYLATLWANVVMDPDAVGLSEDDLESAHDVINLSAERFVGDERAITAAFRFVAGTAGEQAMDKAKVPRAHRDLLLYFSSMILDPEGHRRAMARYRYRNQSDSQGT